MSVKNIARWFVLCASFFVFSAVQASINLSPVGVWTIVDPITKKPEVQIKISENANHTLLGKIIKVYDPMQNRTMCENCPADFKKQPLVGMEVLWHLKKASAYTWSDGRILLPKRGQVFECNLTVTQDGQIITLRIYDNTTKALGKTEIWYRAA